MNKLRALLLLVLSAVLDQISPEIRKLLEDAIAKLYERAQSTKTKIDDLFVRVLARLLDIDLPE